MSDEIWLVNADRGDYSDRTEYPVCWLPTEDEAKAVAERMEAKPNEWNSRMTGSGDRYKLYPAAQADIGDPMWGSHDHTNYSAIPLKRWQAP